MLKGFVTSNPSRELLLKVAMSNAQVGKNRNMVRKLGSPIRKSPGEINAWLKVKKQGRRTASINAIQTRESVVDAVGGLALEKLNRSGKGGMPGPKGRIRNMNTFTPRGGSEVNIKRIMGKIEITGGEPDGTTEGRDNGANIIKQSLFLKDGPLRRDMHINKDENKLARDTKDTQTSTIKEGGTKNIGKVTRP